MAGFITATARYGTTGSVERDTSSDASAFYVIDKTGLVYLFATGNLTAIPGQSDPADPVAAGSLAVALSLNMPVGIELVGGGGGTLSLSTSCRQTREGKAIEWAAVANDRNVAGLLCWNAHRHRGAC